MKVAVRYFSRGGNTKKIAEAIARGAGVEAATVEKPLKEDIDILFLGSAPYAFDVDNAIKKFISDVNVQVGKAVNFSTAAVAKSTRKYVAGLLNQKNIPLAEKEFACRGTFAIFHKGKPDDSDCERAAQFAAKVIADEEAKGRRQGAAFSFIINHP